MYLSWSNIPAIIFSCFLLLSLVHRNVKPRHMYLYIFLDPVVHMEIQENLLQNSEGIMKILSCVYKDFPNFFRNGFKICPFYNLPF